MLSLTFAANALPCGSTPGLPRQLSLAATARFVSRSLQKKTRRLEHSTTTIWYNTSTLTKSDDMSEYCKYCGQEYRDAATLLRKRLLRVSPEARWCGARSFIKWNQLRQEKENKRWHQM